MMKWTLALLIVTTTVVVSVQAQSPDITSFGGNGELTWGNSNTALFYTVEWAASLIGSNTWSSEYSRLVDIQSTQTLVTSKIPMFYRVKGSSNRTYFAAPLSRTWQTNLYLPGDDGAHQSGAPWPHPRFTVLSDTNVILDNLTGLQWARNANLGGPMTWSNAIAYCDGLTYGGASDWRLPNVHEMQSIVDYGRADPAVCNTAGTGPWTENDPFTDVQTTWEGQYWTSTTVPQDDGIRAWRVFLGAGHLSVAEKGVSLYLVWPVRGGTGI